MVSRQVLLVEDEIFVAIDIAEELTALGLDVLGPFHRLADALAATAGRRPDCAVLDVRLADAEVFPLADDLARRGVPLVFHSGHMAASDLLRRYPGATFCEKPCPPFRLAALVGFLLGDRPRAEAVA